MTCEFCTETDPFCIADITTVVSVVLLKGDEGRGWKNATENSPETKQVKKFHFPYATSVSFHIFLRITL